MRILIDYRPLQSAYASRGVGTFCRNIFPRLLESKLGPSLVFCGYSTDTPPAGAVYRTIFRPRFRAWLWEQACWPLDLWRFGAELFWSPVSLGPIRSIGYPRLCPARGVATIHDLTPLRHKELAAHAQTRSFRIQRRAVAEAHRIVTVSSFVKEDIVEHLGVQPDKVVVLPSGVDDAVKEAYERLPDEPDELKAFILAIGETENKNVHTAIAAFERLADEGFWGDLCVVGAFDRQSTRVRTRYQQSAYRERIHFYGDVSTDKLVELYARCELFLFPSASEGFGHPVIEAMYCGAPVIASNATSVPDAGGDAAVYCEPDNAEDFAAQAKTVLDNEDVRVSLRERGRARAKSLSWDTAVEQLVEMFQELVAKS